ncbi:MAG: tRNA pseudouridine(38-40) synthase TruA [Alistipes sp.]|nr:tRNA pseudouridine(38-40) synthase TruA [Alistipes sp.]
MRYFLEIAYKGTAYHGWQKQANAPSVQQTLEDCLSRILREDTSVTGAGRTDTGVHASYYVAHFDSEGLRAGNPAEKEAFVYHLNAVLPHDIAVRTMTAVGAEAHARFDAVLREYKYHVISHKDPFRKDTAWYFRGRPDVEAMNRAAAKLPEYDDFTTFCKLHSDNKTNICNVSYARWEELPGGELVFTIRSDRFLRNMVRSLTGTMMDVGRGKITVSDFESALAAKDLRLAGPTAPAAGLFLSDVRYPENIFRRNK